MIDPQYISEQRRNIMMTPMSNLETQIANLISNPNIDALEASQLVLAMSVVVQYAKDLKGTITNCMNKNLELAKKEKEKKLNSKDYQTAIIETNAYKAKIKELEALVKIFREQKAKFYESLNSTKTLKNLSEKEVAQLSQKEEDYEKINISLNNLLLDVNDQQKKGKGLLRNDLNWLGQVIVRKGKYPGYAKYGLWLASGAEKYQFPIPKELRKPIREATANWSDDPIEKMNVTRKLAEKLDQVASKLRDDS